MRSACSIDVRKDTSVEDRIDVCQRSSDRNASFKVRQASTSMSTEIRWMPAPLRTLRRASVQWPARSSTSSLISFAVFMIDLRAECLRMSRLPPPGIPPGETILSGNGKFLPRPAAAGNPNDWPLKQQPGRARCADRPHRCCLNETLATFNIKHYGVVAGLRTMQPY